MLPGFLLASTGRIYPGGENLTEQVSSIDVLTAEIAELERQLSIKKAALKGLKKLGDAPVNRSQFPYYDMSPKEAIILLFRKTGLPLTEESIVAALVAGGNTIGKKRGVRNVEIGIEKNLEVGNLSRIGDLIGLPIWVEDGEFKKAPGPKKNLSLA